MASEDTIKEGGAPRDVSGAHAAVSLLPPDQFQAVIDGIADPVMVIGVDHRILLANRAARMGMAGYHGDARCHEVSHGRATPCDGEDHPCPLVHVLSGEPLVTLVHKHRAPSGGYCLVELSATPLRDTAGNIIGIVEAAHDITATQQAQSALEVANRRLREAQRLAHIGSWERTFGDDRISCSDEMCAIAGHHCVGRCSFTNFMGAIHEEDRIDFLRGYEHSITEHRPFEMTHRLLQPDGTITYVHSHCETQYDAAGQPRMTYGTVQDVTMGVLTEMSLKESEERFRTIADYTFDWEYWQGPRGEILYCSPSCEEVSGHAMNDFIANPGLLYSIIHPDDQPLMATHRENVGTKESDSLNFRIVRPDGEVRWIAHGCRPVYGRNGRFMGRRASNRDITDLKRAEEHIRQLAHFDPLTGLPNRRLLLDRLQRALAQAKRFHRSIAIMFLDLDHFKQINDTLGHSVGDQLLKQVAGRLAACVRQGDTVARPGGDEFVIVLTELTQPHDAALVAEKIIDTFKQAVVLDRQPLDITTSIGIAIYPIDGADDSEELMKKADMAMYQAKAAGRNTYRIFSAMP